MGQPVDAEHAICCLSVPCRSAAAGKDQDRGALGSGLDRKLIKTVLDSSPDIFWSNAADESHGKYGVRPRLLVIGSL